MLPSENHESYCLRSANIQQQIIFRQKDNAVTKGGIKSFTSPLENAVEARESSSLSLFDLFGASAEAQFKQSTDNRVTTNAREM